MNSFPYKGITKNGWLSITKKLIEKHPLKSEEIRDICVFCWDLLWQTKIGAGNTSILLKKLDVPSIIIGYFFEKLFAKELNKKYPTIWRGNENKEEKDLVYIPDKNYSIEIKTSGQLGTKIFGNRSYGQKTKVLSKEKKNKSGYYITVNFYGRTLNLIRFGWIDFTDWKPQQAPTGQMSGLPDCVYKYKLVTINGDYRLNAPIDMLNGVGEKTAESLKQYGLLTLKDLLIYKGDDNQVKKLQEKLKNELKDA